MPQPSGQVLLDPAKPNYSATSFWYCDGATLWDAKGGATLTKTGTAGTASEGGANVALGNGSTYYALASALSLTGAFTLFFKARTTTNGSTASMITGNRSGTANFVWLAADSGNMQLRASGTTQSYTSTNSATMAHFAVVRNAANVVSVYKNGTLVQSKAISGTLTLTHILSGHSTSSLNLNGALEFMHVVAGAELDAASVASYAADPYQDLLAPAAYATATVGISRSINADYATATATFARSISAAEDSITLTSPTPYQSRQRNLVTGLAAFAVSGTYIGSPASIQYRFNGGVWATLVASPVGGVFSTSVTLPTGQGAFEVRFSNDPAVTASAAFVTVGDGYIVAGQSNHAGRAGVVVAPVPTNFVATKLRRSGEWKELSEALSGAETFDEGVGAQASYFGALSNRLQTVGVPVFFMPCAQGSTSINDWERYDPDPANPYLLYGDMRVADQRAGGHRAVLWLQGETDAANGMAQATYETKLNDLVNDWNTDTGKPFFVIQIVRWSSSIYGQIDAIRAAQAAVAAGNPAVAGIADGNVWQSANDVHYTTSAHINALADVVSAGMVTAFYTAYASTSVAVARSVRGYASQAFGAARSVRGFSAATVGVGRSVRNFAATSRSVARSLRNAVTSSNALARSVRVWSSASAALARTIDAAGYAQGSAAFQRSIRTHALSSTIVVRQVLGYANSSGAISRAILATGFATGSASLARSVLGPSGEGSGPLSDEEMRELLNTMRAVNLKLDRVARQTGLIPALL